MSPVPLSFWLTQNFKILEAWILGANGVEAPGEENCSFIKMPGSLIDSGHGMLMPAERAQGCIQSEHAESAENMRGQTGSPIDYKTDWDWGIRCQMNPVSSGAMPGRNVLQRSGFLRKKASENLRLEPPNVHLILWCWHHLLLGADMFLTFPRSFSIIKRFKHCYMKERTDTEGFRSLLQTALFSLKMKGPPKKIWNYISPQFQKIPHQSLKALFISTIGVGDLRGTIQQGQEQWTTTLSSG